MFDSVNALFKGHPSPILYSQIEKQRWDDAIKRCQEHPLDAQWKHDTKGGSLPLHRICYQTSGSEDDVAAAGTGVPLEVLESLHRANPEGVRTRDDGGYLPLHVACFCGSPLPIVRWLHSTYPEAVRTPDMAGSGRLPLHLACSYDVAPVEVIEFLYEAYPGSVRVRDKYGEGPLDALERTGQRSEREKRLIRSILTAGSGSGVPSSVPLPLPPATTDTKVTATTSAATNHCPNARADSANGNGHGSSTAGNLPHQKLSRDLQRFQRYTGHHHKNH